MAVQISLTIFNEEQIILLKLLEIIVCTISRCACDYALTKDDERIATGEKAIKEKNVFKITRDKEGGKRVDFPTFFENSSI